MAMAVATVGEALVAASDALAAAGVETPRLDAELLLAEATARDRARLATEPDAPVEPPAARSFAAMVRRRLAREPVAYIVGRKGFRHLEIAVDPRALIPRPETELLVETALELAPPHLKGSDPFRYEVDTTIEGPGPSLGFGVLDVGTGSGAVALAVADELEGARIVATDTSAAALRLAAENAERLGVRGRIEFELGSLPAGGRFDLLLANLPYVSEAEWARLAPEITRYEPRAALVAGPTGLEAIEALLGELSIEGTSNDRSPSVTSCEAGAVALEVGAGQAGAVAELVRRAGYESVEMRHDLAGIERVVLGSHT